MYLFFFGFISLGILDRNYFLYISFRNDISLDENEFKFNFRYLGR